MKLESAKRLLMTIIVVTCLIPLTFVRFTEPGILLKLAKLLAKAGSLVGTGLLTWQLLLGFRGFVSRIHPDLNWNIELHKNLGKYGILLILLHPVFISIYYWRLFGMNIFSPAHGSFFSFVVLGIAALLLLFLIGATSVFWRRKMSFRMWERIHLSSYLVLPLVLIHGRQLGMTIRGTALGALWTALIGLIAVMYLYRLAAALGFTAIRYQVTRREQVDDRVSEISMKPIEGPGLEPNYGQFVYFRRSLREGSHPYSVTWYDGVNGEIAVGVKALGKASREAQSIQPGETVFIDGPYGVFGHDVLVTKRPLVMIAGGIGITPFIRIMRRLDREPDRESWLFYANERCSDVAYEEFLKSTHHTSIVHVMNNEPGFPGEKGLVTMDLLRRHLKQGLREYEYLICGPPPMIRGVEAGLIQSGVPAARIHHELFNM